MAGIIAAMRAHPQAKACYVTRPDYYGNTVDLRDIAEEAHRHPSALLHDRAVVLADEDVGQAVVVEVPDGHPGGVVVGAGVRYEGRTLLPDVDEACEAVAGWITPRVGGVGPTTIAMLFRNLVEAAERNAAH